MSTRFRSGLVVALVAAMGAAFGCGTSQSKIDYIEGYLFPGSGAQVCAEVEAAGSVEAAAANAMLRVSIDRPDLGITVEDVQGFLEGHGCGAGGESPVVEAPEGEVPVEE